MSVNAKRKHTHYAVLKAKYICKKTFWEFPLFEQVLTAESIFRLISKWNKQSLQHRSLNDLNSFRTNKL